MADQMIDRQLCLTRWDEGFLWDVLVRVKKRVELTMNVEAKSAGTYPSGKVVVRGTSRISNTKLDWVMGSFAYVAIRVNCWRDGPAAKVLSWIDTEFKVVPPSKEEVETWRRDCLPEEMALTGKLKDLVRRMVAGVEAGEKSVQVRQLEKETHGCWVRWGVEARRRKEELEA
jgi:hypothetical protein